MDRLRVPFFVVALLALILAILCEAGAADFLNWLTRDSLHPATPGLGIHYLAIFDGMLVWSVTIMALGIPARPLIGRIQGIATLVASFFALLGTIALIFLAFGLLIVMVTLLVAIPFGTIAYLAAWGHFAAGAAAATLLIIMVLKIVFCICLLLAQQDFLKNKGLIILTAASMGFTWVVGFLQAFPPGFLVSIADAIGALVIGVVGAVWLLVLFIGSIRAILAAMQTGRAPEARDWP